MEVTIQSLLQNEAQGRVRVSCDLDDNVDSLISAFCVEKGVRQKRDYILKTSANDTLHNTRKIGTCGIQKGEILYLANQGKARDKHVSGHSCEVNLHNRIALVDPNTRFELTRSNISFPSRILTQPIYHDLDRITLGLLSPGNKTMWL